MQLNKLLHEIISHPNGRYSLRKFLAVYSCVIVAAVLTWRYCTISTAWDYVSLWLTYSLVMLGIITAEHLDFLKFKKGNTDVSNGMK